MALQRSVHFCRTTNRDKRIAHHFARPSRKTTTPIDVGSGHPLLQPRLSPVARLPASDQAAFAAEYCHGFLSRQCRLRPQAANFCANWMPEELPGFTIEI
jgi:hypothetical protein